MTPDDPSSIINTPSGQDNRVLLIEDSEAIALVLERLLTKSNYQVTKCKSIKEAREAFLHTNHQLVLSDQNLPDGQGSDFINWCRSQNGNEDIAAIILSGNDPEMNLIHEPKYLLWLTKPFNVRELIGNINDLVAQSKTCSL